VKQGELVPYLIKKFPAFKRPWDDHMRDWGPDTPGLYFDMGPFSDFIMSLYERGDLKQVREVFECLESILEWGDEDLWGLLVVGILEKLYIGASWKPYGSRVFMQFSGPKTLEGWSYLERTWAGKTSLAEVIREEIDNLDSHKPVDPK
jgi:hypothetical protein